jgi:DNA invertase Pin-like site-specific DNA recombinase
MDEIVKAYKEKGKSGKNTDRPELQALFSDIQSGKINTVICTKIDRISRSLLDFYK